MNIDATRAHVDAETMAAWADRALPAEEAAAVELHLSNCDRCQEVLAAFVRSAPQAGAVIIPFWARRPVQWSAAGLAAAAALVAMVWIGRPPALPAPESTVASRSVAPEPSASAPSELRRDKPAPTAVDQLQAKPSPVGPAPAELRKERSASAADLRRDKQTSALQKRVAANDAAAKTAPPPPMPAGALAAPPPAAAPVAPPPPPVTVSAAAPVVTPVGAARPGAMYESVAVGAISAIPIIEIVAPDPNPPAMRSTAGAAGGAGARAALSQNVAPARWRIVAGTHIERSLDAGATWTSLPIEPALTTTLRAGVATSQSNCWLVGRGGVVLVTDDGRTFRRVSVPEAIQLVSVIATDALRATVTAVDGRRFSTIDGGLTWK